MLRMGSSSGRSHSPLRVTTPARTKIMMTVRKNVARSELMFETPIFPKTAVNAANSADPTAKICQELRQSMNTLQGRSLMRGCDLSFDERQLGGHSRPTTGNALD